MENDLHTFTFDKADWVRIQQALRANAQDNYRKMVELGEQGAYYEILWQERAILNDIADMVEVKLP